MRKLHELRTRDRSGADDHTVAHRRADLADGIGGFVKFVRIPETEGDFHCADAAVIQGLRKLREMSVKSADDGDDPGLADHIVDLLVFQENTFFLCVTRQSAPSERTGKRRHIGESGGIPRCGAKKRRPGRS